MVTIRIMEHTNLPEVHKEHSLLIDSMGGTVAVSRLCDVTSQAVSKWRRGSGIPKHQLKFIKAVKPEFFSAKNAA